MRNLVIHTPSFTKLSDSTVDSFLFDNPRLRNVSFFIREVGILGGKETDILSY